MISTCQGAALNVSRQKLQGGKGDLPASGPLHFLFLWSGMLAPPDDHTVCPYFLQISTSTSLFSKAPPQKMFFLWPYSSPEISCQSLLIPMVCAFQENRDLGAAFSLFWLQPGRQQVTNTCLVNKRQQFSFFSILVQGQAMARCLLCEEWMPWSWWTPYIYLGAVSLH